MDVGTKIDNRPVSETEQDKDIVKIGVLSTWVPTKVAHGLAFIWKQDWWPWMALGDGITVSLRQPGFLF